VNNIDVDDEEFEDIGNENTLNDRSSGPLGIAYSKLSNALFNSLEKAATANEKYRDVVRLENYYYFASAIGNLINTTKANAANLILAEQGIEDDGSGAAALAAQQGFDLDEDADIVNKGDVHELEGAVALALTHFEENVSRYLAWNFRYEFKEIYEYFNEVEKLVNNRGIEDVHIHLNKESLLSIMNSHGSSNKLKDKIKQVYKRLNKHLSKELNLIKKIWKRFAKFFHSTWEKFVLRSEQCYGYKLEPDADAVKTLVLQTGGSS
jgi:hypothetical protein